MAARARKTAETPPKDDPKDQPEAVTTPPENDGPADESKDRPDDLDGGDNEALDEVQEKVDDETTRGYRGTEVDPTPNENYTVAGVAAGKPTPETDPDTAAEIAGKATTKFNNK